MATASEADRARLGALLASTIERLGITEVARMTGVSDTTLRKYVTHGIPAGVRSGTLAELRRLATATAEAESEEPTTPQLLEQLRWITEELAARLESQRGTGDGPGALLLRGAHPGTADSRSRDKRRRA